MAMIQDGALAVKVLSKKSTLEVLPSLFWIWTFTPKTPLVIYLL